MNTSAALVSAIALAALAPTPGVAQPYGYGGAAAPGEAYRPSYQTQATMAAEREREARAAQAQNPNAAGAPVWNGEQRDSLRPDQRTRRSHTGNKVAGCVVGGLLGGLLGASVANQQNRNAAIAAGAAAGCVAGFAFAASWSKRDRAALDARTEEILARPQAESEVWRAPESQQQVVLTSSPPVIETQRVEFEHLDFVTPPQKGAQVISRPYRATDILRLRSSPDASSDDNIVGRFERGDTVEVVGASADGNWAMVGYDGVVVGYASSAYLAPMDARETLRTVPTAKPRLERPAPTRTASAAPSRPQTRKSSLPAMPETRVKKTKVLASTQCKSIVAASGQQADRKKGCAQPTGEWTFA